MALGAVLVFVALGATLAALDAALNELGEVRLKAMRDVEGVHAALADRAVRDFTSIRARLLTGRVLCLAMAASLGAHSVAQVDGVAASLAAAFLVALLYGVVAEAATTVARIRASSWAVTLLRWLRPVELVLVPLAAPLVYLAKFLDRHVTRQPEADSEKITAMAVEQVIEDGEESGSITEEHAELLRSVLEFKDTVVREVMVPRTQVCGVEIASSIETAVRQIVSEGHSRYPVFRDKLDQIEGVLYAKDLFRVLTDANGDAAIRLRDVARMPVLFCPETQKISAVLHEMQSKRVHLAVVVDEFGGTSGIITLEDILEEIVGDIRDEYDQEEVPVRQMAPGHYVADAGVSVYDVEEFIGASLRDVAADGNGAPEFESLGGLVSALAGRVPAVGDSVVAGNFALVVRDADARHVKRVELVRRAAAGEAAE